VFVDTVESAGAVGGVLTGLEKLPPDAERGLFLAVDLPLVPASLLAHLLGRAEEGVDAVACYSPGGPEPLCAVYARSCLEPVRRNVEAGRLKMTDFWTEICIHVVYPGALEAHGQPDRIFRNANTPEDYERLSPSA
jgi:molybdopterin-guanine dinucleotide biosynthesis protein A